MGMGEQRFGEYAAEAAASKRWVDIEAPHA
jgi:hypothetical protein